MSAHPMSAYPRAFLLIRHVDVTGVSGTGVIAEGVEWRDGTASLRWQGEHPTITFFSTGITGIDAIHGHRGKTEIVYDGARPMLTPRPDANLSRATDTSLKPSR